MMEDYNNNSVLDGSGSSRISSRSIKSSSSRQSKQPPPQQHQLRQSSSIGSSSSQSSRRRAKESATQLQKKEQQLVKQQRRGSRDYSTKSNKSNNNNITEDIDGSTATSRSDRFPTIMEVGGGDFVEELAPHPRGRMNNSAAASNKNYGGSGRYSNQQSLQQRRLSSQQPSSRNSNPRAVVHACDDKGRCIFHPHIQLRKKAIMGVLGGWKDIRRYCPDCERQELLSEMMAREEREIEQMERILDQMDQLDVEYLNDDDDDEVEGESDEEGESVVLIEDATGDAPGSSSQRNTTTTATTTSPLSATTGKGRGGGGGLEPPGDFSRRSSNASTKSSNKERNPVRVQMEEQQQQQRQQQQQQQRRVSRQQQQQQQSKQLPSRKRRSPSPKGRNSNYLQSRRRRTISPKKDRNDTTNNNNVGKQQQQRNSLPKKNRSEHNHHNDDDDSSSSYSSSSSSSSSPQQLPSSYKRNQLTKERSWKKMMITKKTTKKKKSLSNNDAAISSYISGGIPNTTTAVNRSKSKRSEQRRRGSNNSSNDTPPPPQLCTPATNNHNRRSITRQRSIKLMKGMNKSVTKGVTGILREGKKISHSVKRQISSSFNNGAYSMDEYDWGDEDDDDGEEGHSYYSSESDSSDSSDNDDDNQYRKSDPVGLYGGVRQQQQPSTTPQRPAQKGLGRQDSVDSAATFTNLKHDKDEILDLHASILQQQPQTSDGIRVFGGKADPISEEDGHNNSLASLQERRSSAGSGSAGTKKEMHSSFNSSATFTDLKQEKGEIFDLHASITKLHLSREEELPTLQEQKGMEHSSFNDSSAKDSFNDSSATYTDAQQEKGEIVDLHTSIKVGGRGYEHLRQSLTQGEIDDLHASLTELMGPSYNETLLMQATQAAATNNSEQSTATNNSGFNDSSATFTDHSRDRGEIVDMHASLTQLQGPSNLLPRIDSDNSSGTYTDYETDLDEMQNLHASLTHLQMPIGSADSSSSSVDDNASFTDIILKKVRKSSSGGAMVDAADDNASFTDICLNMMRKSDPGVAELDVADDNASFTDICLDMLRKSSAGAAELAGEDDIDDDASFTDMCINMVLRKSDSDAKQQRRARKRRSLSVDASDGDFDMVAFDSDKFSHQTDTMQVPPKPMNDARLRAERWEQARKVFSAKIEEERMKEEGIEYQTKTDSKRRVSFGEIVEELRPQLSKPAEEMTEEDKTRLRAELWKQARIQFSEQIAEEERITKEELEKQLLEEKANTLHDTSNSVSVVEQQQTTETIQDAQHAADLLEKDNDASSTEQSPSEQGSEQADVSDVAANLSSVEPTINRLDNEQTDLTDSSEQSNTTGTSGLDDNQEEEFDFVTKAEPKTFDVTNLPYTGNFGESGMYTGTVNEKYQPNGKGIMMYDNGEELKGHWKNGDFLRESELYSDSEDDDDDDEEEEDDLNSSMADVSAKKRDRSRSRSKSKDRHVAKSPPRPTFQIGDTGQKSDMITDKDTVIALIEKLSFGDGAFIRRSDGNWTYAEVKSFEETPEGRSSVRFIVNQKNSSKSYAKKYWKTHIRPLKVAPPKKSSSSSVERTGRGRDAVDNINSSAEESNRAISCPPVQSRLSFDWPTRRGRSRSRSLRRSVSASPMGLHSISEITKEEEAGEE